MNGEIDILCPRCHEQNRSSARYCQHCGFDVVLNNDMPGTDNRRYFITRAIKVGGQGSVYEGVDQNGRVYAIKEMLDDFTDPDERAEAEERFNAEARLLQGLNHPRIPRVYSHFTDEGRHYLTMDFVQGEDLEEILEREGVIPEAQVLEWAYQICDVLSHLHENDLIYRDMKPSNVMIESDGNVKVVDFGIAKLFKPNERGTQIGTPGYAPPEQYQGLATRVSDIYALGATLHHLLTGRDPRDHPPFSFEPVRNYNIAVSQRTSDAIEKALNFNAEERYGTVAEFRAMLRPLVGTQPSLSQSSPHKTVTIGTPPATPPSSSATPRPGSPSSPQQHASKPPKQKPQPKPKKRRNPCGCVVGVLLLVGGIAALAYGLLTGLFVLPLPNGQPTTTAPAAPAAPTPPTSITSAPAPTRERVSEQFTTDVEITIDSGAADPEIRTAFRDAYIEKARETYGDDIEVNRTLIVFVSTNDPDNPSWEKVSEENGNTRYRARMQSLVQRE